MPYIVSTNINITKQRSHAGENPICTDSMERPKISPCQSLVPPQPLSRLFRQEYSAHIGNNVIMLDRITPPFHLHVLPLIPGLGWVLSHICPKQKDQNTRNKKGRHEMVEKRVVLHQGQVFKAAHWGIHGSRFL